MISFKRIVDIVVGLAVIGGGVYIYMDSAAIDRRFEQESVLTAEAVPVSPTYTETRRRWGIKTYATDLRFKTQNGQTVTLRDTDISTAELEQLQHGQPILREYLSGDPHTTREPGSKAPKWPAAIFAVVGLMIAFFGLGWKEKAAKKETEAPEA